MEKLIERLSNESIIDNEKKKISCKKAFEIASELNISILEVGKACNREKIKISSCQLGCFK
jgi:hypothetical protein